MPKSVNSTLTWLSWALAGPALGGTYACDRTDLSVVLRQQRRRPPGGPDPTGPGPPEDRTVQFAEPYDVMVPVPSTASDARRQRFQRSSPWPMPIPVSQDVTDTPDL